MRGVFAGSWRSTVAVVVVLAGQVVWAGEPLLPTDPPERRIAPPVGVTSQARLQPPGGVPAERRIAPPVGVAAERRIQPPVGFDQSYFEQFMLWLRTQIRPIR
jgi:hypothetical protein